MQTSGLAIYAQQEQRFRDIYAQGRSSYITEQIALEEQKKGSRLTSQEMARCEKVYDLFYRAAEHYAAPTILETVLQTVNALVDLPLKAIEYGLRAGGVPKGAARATHRAMDDALLVTGLSAVAKGVVKKTARVSSRVENSLGFKGRKGFELKNAPYQNVRNTPATINDREFSSHALDQMQNRGIMPSIVENTIREGIIFSTRPGTVGYYDRVNNLRIITNAETGRIITIIPGDPFQ